MNRETDRVLFLGVKARRSQEESAEFRQKAVSIGRDHCIALAQACFVLPLLLDAFALDVPEFSLSTQDLRSQNRERVEGLIGTLSDAVSVFPRGLRWCAIEGASVLLGTDMPTHAYAAGDFDILVDNGGAASLAACLADVGFVRKLKRGSSNGRIELCKSDSRFEYWIELCDAPFERTLVPSGMNQMTADWLSRYVSSPRWASLNTLEPSDALTVACVHASLHGFVRPPGLRLYAEIDRLIADHAIDWPTLVGDLGALGAERRGFISLSIASTWLGTPVPTEVLDALRPPQVTVKRLNRLVGVASLTRPNQQPLGLRRMVQLETELDGTTAAVWLSRAIVPPTAWLRSHFGRGDRVGWWRLQGRRVAALLKRRRPS